MAKEKRELQFQIDAVDTVLEKLREKDEVHFQSPTGSGKTFIISQIIQEILLKTPDFIGHNITFVLIAPSTGKLDYQAYEKITKYLKDDWACGFNTEYIGIKDKSSNKYLGQISHLEPRSVYFLGWSLLGSGTNFTKIDSERNNIFRILNNTKSNNTKVILIIDEAHREFGGIKSVMKEEVLKMLKPVKTILVSATLDNPDVRVSLKDVRKESAIKEWVKVTSGRKIGDKKFDNYDEIEELISLAIEKQNEIKKAYYKKRIQSKPLILIQIPNNSRSNNSKVGKEKLDNYYLNRVENILSDKGYKKGFNYAVWFHDRKTTKSKKEIEDIDSQYEILIFKQAVATGWDLPRANILVRLREPISPRFNIQTLGRILRNPFFKYYKDGLIDWGYVFTKDKKYVSIIEKEDFVNTPTKFKCFERSSKSIRNDFKINKLILEEKKLDRNILLWEVANEIKEKVKKCFLDQKKKLLDQYGEDVVYDAMLNTSIIEEPDKTREIMQDNILQSFALSKNRESLLMLYIKYKARFASDLLPSLLTDILSEMISPDIKKKDFYKCVISGWNKTFFKIIGEKGNIKYVKLIDFLKHSIKKYYYNGSSTKTQEYKLPTVFTYSEEFAKENWDKINTYKLKANIKSLDSSGERKFYEHFKVVFSGDKNIHLFRNGVGKESFYIEYINRFFVRSKFYPDFIIFNEKSRRAFILEIKSYVDIDRETENKVNWVNDNFSKIKKNYSLSFYKGVFMGEDWVFEGKNETDRYDWSEFLNLIKKIDLPWRH